MSQLSTDLSSVVRLSDSENLLFQVKQTPNQASNYLAYYEGVNSDETQVQQYVSKTIKADSNTVYVNKQLPVIAAVSYQNVGNKQDEIRIYYVDSQTTGPPFNLRELVKSGSDPWKNGASFNDSRFQLAPGSGISATVNFKSSQLKLFVTNAEGYLNCIYANLDKGNWAQRTNINE